ncbi:alpha/beta hydrolase [Advenella sp. RU8]|uniref:alpha/beta hydrolase n=1 Tax=Advenella sp. RU8 TaxID=3399575 RepID=UPI003AAFE1FB
MNRFVGFFKSLSGIGLILGVLCFAASLTPSLIPRDYVTQGVLSGLAFGAGYGIGALVRALWRYMELPGLPSGVLKVTTPVLSLFCLVLLATSLYHTKTWQNSVRSVVGMDPVESGYPTSVFIIGLLTFVVLLLLALALISFGKFLTNKVYNFFPRRVSVVAGIALSVFLIITLTNGVLVEYTFRVLDKSFEQYDALLEPDRPQPLIAERSGSPDSKLDWRELGRAGREFVSSGPTAADISAFSQQEAMEPIRLYAGLQVAETPEERSQLLLEELIRVKAFDRSALVIITPTGTGWVDPSAMDGLEYLLNGDIASVALQYSYLNSPLALVFQPESGLDSSQALFRTIYNYWKDLPAGQRPKLYLHGLSLGAFHSQRSLTFFDILSDPISGAVWSGPPFPSEMWRELTNEREAGSPEWLPVYQGGRFVRFMNQDGTFNNESSQWGDLRFVYLQYASDAITFFEKDLFYREADWMKAPRGPDVSPLLKWYPVVSMLQLLVDMPLADTVPMGYGHVYAPGHYLDAWLEVTGIDTWSAERIQALKTRLLKKTETGDGYESRGG